MFEVGQKCYTYKERLFDCSSQDMRKSRYDIVKCTIIAIGCSCDEAFVSFRQITRWREEITSYVKILQSRLFASHEDAKSELIRVEDEIKNNLPRKGDLVGFVMSVPDENGGYTTQFFTSVVTKVNKMSVQLMNTVNKNHLSLTLHNDRTIILSRAEQKKTKKQLKEEQNNV